MSSSAPPTNTSKRHPSPVLHLCQAHSHNKRCYLSDSHLDPPHPPHFSHSPNTSSIPLGGHTPNLPPLYQLNVGNREEKWIRKGGESRHIDLSERLTQTPGCLLTSALPSPRRKSRGLTTSETDPTGCASDRFRIS